MARHARAEKLTDERIRGLCVVHLIVLWNLAAEQRFVSCQELGFRRAPSIPEQHDPAVRFQDPIELLPRQWAIEPVKGLGCGDQVDRLRIERRCFGRAIDTAIVVMFTQTPIRLGTHRPVGLDSNDPAPADEQFLGENASA